MPRKKYKDPVPDRPRNISPYIPLTNGLIKEADVKYKENYKAAESYKYGVLLAHNDYIKDTDITPYDTADINNNIDIIDSYKQEGYDACMKMFSEM